MKKLFTSWATWVVVGIILLIVIALVRSGPGGSAETFTGSFVMGYEGDFTKLTYELSYPKDTFSIAGEGRTITLTETTSGNAHKVEFFWNGAAGFGSVKEFWETQYQNKCADCRESTSTLRVKGVGDVISFENDAEEWFVAGYDAGKNDYFIIAKFMKPSDAAKKVVETLNIKTEPAPNPEKPEAPQGGVPEGRTIPLKVYFMNPKIKPTVDCKEVIAVTAVVPYTQGVARAALEFLLQGPTRADLGEGYVTNIPEGGKLNSLTIVIGEARADFNAATESGGGSCSMAGRVAQITETLKQFPTVKSVKLSIEGRTGDIFQP